MTGCCIHLPKLLLEAELLINFGCDGRLVPSDGGSGLFESPLSSLILPLFRLGELGLFVLGQNFELRDRLLVILRRGDCCLLNLHLLLLFQDEKTHDTHNDLRRVLLDFFFFFHLSLLLFF